MRRTVLVAGAVSFVLAFLGTVTAMSLMMPALVEAQEARIRAESVTIVGAGTDRLRLATKWDGQGSDFSLLDPGGTTRLTMAAGGIAVSDPAGSGINIYAEDGTQVARLGIGHGPAGNLPLTTQLILFDQEGRNRIRLAVAQDGTPAMLMYNADGSVIWSAP